MQRYRVAVIPGDGIGNEVTPAAIRVLEAAAARFEFAFAWEEFPWGSDHYFEHGRMMPADALDRLGRSTRFSSARSAIRGSRTTSR